MYECVGYDLREKPHEPITTVRDGHIGLGLEFDNELPYDLIDDYVLIHEQISHGVDQIVPYSIAFQLVDKAFCVSHCIDNGINKFVFQGRIALL
jgi:hypothetical protein